VERISGKIKRFTYGTLYKKVAGCEGGLIRTSGACYSTSKCGASGKRRKLLGESLKNHLFNYLLTGGDAFD